MRKTMITAVVAGVVGAMLVAPVAVYASHSFNDVPDTNTFHSDIAWLAESGVTKGCNPPANTEFCPADEVSRGQMAAFMRRFAQYLDAEDGTPAQADNADTLDGLDAVELVPTAAFNSIEDVPGQNLFILPVEITAPAPGILILTGNVEASNDILSDVYFCSLLVDGDEVPGTNMSSQLHGTSSTNQEEDCTTTGAAAVDTGTHTVELEVSNVEPTTDVGNSTIWALWVPTIEN